MQMKATGIVRRIDELGRVVIPKEIRRTLRIREGDALEIYTDREGGVILKKYSLVGELCDFAKEYAESIQQSVGHIAAICDKDTIIAISSPHRRDIAIGSPLAVDKPIHDDVEAVMQMREKLNRSTANGDAMIGITQNDEQGRAYTAQLIIPILAAGRCHRRRHASFKRARCGNLPDQTLKLRKPPQTSWVSSWKTEPGSKSNSFFGQKHARGLCYSL